MRRRRMTWIGGGGFVTLMALLAVPRPRAELAPDPGPVSLPAPAPAGPRIASPERLEAQERRSLETEWRRDPFLHVGPPDDVDGSPPVLPAPTIAPRLQGISGSRGTWLALIDGHLVRTGDRLPSGDDVVEITQHTVTLRGAGGDVTLRL